MQASRTQMTVEQEMTKSKAKRAAIQQGIEDADTGRLVSAEMVMEWLQSKGTEKELARPGSDIS